MKRNIAVAFTVCLTNLAFADRGQQAHVLPSGLALHTPAGWQLSLSDKSGVLTPPQQETDWEFYQVGVMTEVQSLDDAGPLQALVARLFQSRQTPVASGQPVPFPVAGGRGVVHTFDRQKLLIPFRVNYYLVEISGQGIAGLVAIGRRDLIEKRHATLMAIASGFNAGTNAAPVAIPTGSPRSNSAIVSRWMQHLTDKKLVQFSGYSSGGGSGGMSSERKLYLAADGSYAFRSSSSVSIYVPGASGGSSGQNADQGRWRVVDQGGEAILELASAKGANERITLSMNGTQTFLNGRRWFVVGINE